MEQTAATARPAPDEIAIEGAIVAQALGLAIDAFVRLMERHSITVLCERGIGEDAGIYRATFYYGPRRARLLVDARGRLVAPVATDNR